ncbi:BLUF domain-containing protein [Tateyamaria armeniaca]|uniref:BLUF domain-containing protein n=1 Tax=Tateyamaria armeniaca TaxID=2518930 RepID=A0ABW8UQC7_9RHOB
MSLSHLIYASQPFGYDESVLAGILLDARRCNKRDGITGALICRADIYLQMLEGPEQQVAATFERIRGDDRHLDIRVLASEAVDERMFGAWDMLHDPAKSWLWTREEIIDGALDRATPDDVTAVFAGLAAKATVD